MSKGWSSETEAKHAEYVARQNERFLKRVAQEHQAEIMRQRGESVPAGPIRVRTTDSEHVAQAKQAAVLHQTRLERHEDRADRRCRRVGGVTAEGVAFDTYVPNVTAYDACRVIAERLGSPKFNRLWVDNSATGDIRVDLPDPEGIYSMFKIDYI